MMNTELMEFEERLAEELEVREELGFCGWYS